MAVDGAATVGFVERIGDLRAVFQGLIEWERTLFQPLGESFTFDALHHQIIGAILLADVMERADVWMVQAGDGFRFAFEALLANRIRAELRGKDLDGDAALQPRIARPIDFAHSAGTERSSNLVRAKMCTWGQGHDWRRLYSRNSVARYLQMQSRRGIG